MVDDLIVSPNGAFAKFSEIFGSLSLFLLWSVSLLYTLFLVVVGLVYEV